MTGSGNPGGRVLPSTEGRPAAITRKCRRGPRAQVHGESDREEEFSRRTAGGTYALHIPGIGQPLEFTLEPAQVYGSPEQIPGVREMADQWIWAVGEREDEMIKVSVFSWPKDESRSYRMWIRDISLKALKGEDVQEKHRKKRRIRKSSAGIPGVAMERDGKFLSAVPNRQPVFYGRFALPDSPDEASYTLTITDPIVTSMEESQLIRLPVSGAPGLGPGNPVCRGTIRLAQYERLGPSVFRIHRRKEVAPGGIGEDRDKEPKAGLGADWNYGAYPGMIRIGLESCRSIRLTEAL